MVGGRVALLRVRCVVKLVGVKFRFPMLVLLLLRQARDAGPEDADSGKVHVAPELAQACRGDRLTRVNQMMDEFTSELMDFEVLEMRSLLTLEE